MSALTRWVCQAPNGFGRPCGTHNLIAFPHCTVCLMRRHPDAPIIDPPASPLRRPLDLEEYLRRAFAKHILDHRVRIERCDGDRVHISIEPAREGDGLEFSVDENDLTNISEAAG